MKSGMMWTAILVVVAALGAFGLAQTSKPTSQPKTPASKPSTKAGMVYVQMKTTAGDIFLELNGDKAPKTVENFLGYVDSGFYKNLVFHRVIKNFMAQGGGFEMPLNSASRPKPPTQKPVMNEADNGLKNEYGTIAMARMPNPHSATSQFFINLKDNTFLNHRSKDANGWGYCVFGRVIAGFDVVEAMNNAPKLRSPLNAKERGKTASLLEKMVTIKEVKRIAEAEADRAAKKSVKPKK